MFQCKHLQPPSKGNTHSKQQLEQQQQHSIACKKWTYPCF
jgi:hypothetical protein